MVKRIYNCYINSQNRDANEPIYNFRIDFPQGHIDAKENEIISINVLSFDMMNSMYNVSSINGNNQFSIKRTNADGVSSPILTTYIIPSGNYDVISFTSILNGLLSGIIIVSYNQYQNTFTYTNNDTVGHRYFLSPLGAYKLLGIKLNTVIEVLTTGTTGSFVNMVNYNKVILRVENISFDRYNYENLRDSDNLLNNGDVLFWITKSDVPPFKMISYNNIDGGSSFHSDLFDKQVDAINLILTNEYNSYITDAPDYLLSLQFEVNSNDERMIKTNTEKILIMINEIFDLLMMFLKYIGFFKDIKK